MKKILLITAIAGVFTACGNGSESTAVADSTTMYDTASTNNQGTNTPSNDTGSGISGGTTGGGTSGAGASGTIGDTATSTPH